MVQPSIHAFDLDTGINARLRYTIILGNEETNFENNFFFCIFYNNFLKNVKIFSGNEGGFFEMHDQTGELFLVREIDLESLPNAILSLQIQVT